MISSTWNRAQRQGLLEREAQGSFLCTRQRSFRNWMWCCIIIWWKYLEESARASRSLGELISSKIILEVPIDGPSGKFETFFVAKVAGSGEVKSHSHKCHHSYNYSAYLNVSNREQHLFFSTSSSSNISRGYNYLDANSIPSSRPRHWCVHFSTS